LAAAQDPQFAAQSRLVLVPVTVTDANGRTVDGLEPGSFLVVDNGRPQKITVDTIGTGVAPIALIVAIQASGISKPVLEKVRKIGAMIRPIVTGERGCAGVVSFSERITWIQECTNDEDAIALAFERIHPGEAKSARMLDAAAEAIERLKKHPNSRRILLLISESRDRGSETDLSKVAVDAQTAGVTVYSATYSAIATAFTTKSSATGEPHPPKVPQKPSEQTGTVSGAPPTCNPFGCPDPPVPTADQRVDLLGGIGELVRLGKTNTTQALAKGTGGTTFPFTRLKGLEQAIQKLGDELHSQYVLSFTPNEPSVGYHEIQVRVASGEYRIRARPGYWSTQVPASDGNAGRR
jgi:VWFA-related protein